MTRPTYGSVFSGIGGLDLATELAFDVDCAWQCERDSYARSVCQRHWPDVRRFTDIRDINERSGVECDILIGGPPCQDVSVAGRGAGMGSGTRSGLWDDMLRIALLVRPAIILVENPARSRARWLPTVTADLAAGGYWWAYLCIRASELGFRHERDRVFVIAADADDNRQDRRSPESLIERARAVWLELAQHDAPHTDCHGREGRGRLACVEASPTGGSETPARCLRRTALARVVRDLHGVSDRLDGPPQQVGRGVPHRIARVHALGNAVIPAQAAHAIFTLTRGR